MQLVDFELLEKIGLNLYERRTLLAALRRGVADAATLCEEGDVPTSKIYLATEKLGQMGLLVVQRSRPRLFAALSPEDVATRLGEIAKEEADRFAKDARAIVDMVKSAADFERGEKTFADLALGPVAHMKRHVVHLATAESSIVSYLERADIAAFSHAKANGFNLFRRIKKTVADRQVDHRAVFGFAHRDAPSLLTFLHEFRSELEAMTGVRYAGVLGHPFHVIDGETVILSLDNAFLPEPRFASLMIKNRDLASALREGFEALWRLAMKDLGEIRVHPDALASKTK